MIRLRSYPLLAWSLLLAVAVTLASAQPLPSAPVDNPLRDSAPQTLAEYSLVASPQPDSQGNESQGENDGEGQASDSRPTSRQTYTKEQIDELIAQVDQLQLSDDEKLRAKKFYQDAQQSTIEREAQERIARDSSLAYSEAADEDKSDAIAGHTKSWYEQQLATPIDQILNRNPLDLKNASLEELEKRATKREEYANKWSKRTKELQEQPAIRKQFINNVSTKRQPIEQQLEKTQSQLEGIAVEGIKTPVTEARRVALVQQAAKLEAELQAIAEQRKAYERAQEVFELEMKLTQRKAAWYDGALATVRNELSERRKREANKQIQAAEMEAQRNRELIERNEAALAPLAGFNQSLTTEIKQLISEHEQVQAERDQVTKLNDTLKATYTRFESEFGDGVKLSQAGGQLLRDQRAKLPRVAQLRGELTKRTNQKNDISFRRFEAMQRQKTLEQLDSIVGSYLQQVSPEDRGAAAPVVRNLLESQVKYLQSYIENLDKLDAELGELISAKVRLRETTEQFRDFIAERDLWIRSCQPLWTTPVGLGELKTLKTQWRPFYLAPAINAVGWSLNPINWLQALDDLRGATYRRPLNAIAIGLAFLLLLYAQQQARRQIKQLGIEAAKKTCTEFLPSLRAVWLTVIVALPWPLLMWGIGWLLEGPLIEAEFTLALSQSIRTTAWILLLTEFFRQSCRSEGLAEAHLGWPRVALLQLRRYLRWIPIIIAPLVFWFVGLDVQSTEPLWSASLGRVLFLVVMAYAALVLWRLLMSHSSPIYQQLSRGAENWLLNLHRVWRPVLVLMPIALGVMATMGYYYTAEQLAKRVLATAAMLLVLMIAGGMLRRWVLLNRRQLAREQAKQRRAQAQAAANEGEEVSSLAEYVEEAVDLTALSEATRKLLRVLLLVTGVIGAIVIWQDVFPALAWLDENALPWSSGDSPTTWGHLLRSLLALGVTYVAVRDLPSLLELVVLQHLPIDQGARYAISTLARYTLLAFGIVVAAAALGITGTSISWLVAAMGVGLGFGLQEIFANFVSGIILLFERPIRVGDIITLGEKTGVVSRIRMRATTITDWDRKEYVVPNKDLVTERLLNWTLSDQTNRIVIEVGVAYGSDTDKACQLLREVVEGHPEILDDPMPLITFEGFGDSTLNLIVRCYLPSLEKRLQTIHELHTTINQRFNQAGIEIAFPQRDLHIRSMPDAWQPKPTADAAASNGQHEAAEQAETS